MKNLFCIVSVIVVSLFSASATVQQQELIVIKGDTLVFFSSPLYEYLSKNKLEIHDVLGVKRTINTSCWRGYVAVWLLENDKLYLTQIRNSNYHPKKNPLTADLAKLFGTKYQDGKVLADWCTEKIYVQYGDMVFNYMIGAGRIYANEIELNVVEGQVKSSRDYPTLTATGKYGYIRIWNGKTIDTDRVAPRLGEIARKNFVWSDQMTQKCEVKVLFYVVEEHTNKLYTQGEYRRKNTLDLIVFIKKELASCDDEVKKKRFNEIINDARAYLVDNVIAVNEEYDKNGPYIIELKRILEPVQVETLLVCGKPLVCIFEHSYRFDPSTQTISIIQRSRY